MKPSPLPPAALASTLALAAALAGGGTTFAQSPGPRTDLAAAELAGPVRAVTEYTFEAEYRMGTYVPTGEELEDARTRTIYTAEGRFDTVYLYDFASALEGDPDAEQPSTASGPPLTYTAYTYDEEGRVATHRTADGAEARMRYAGDSVIVTKWDAGGDEVGSYGGRVDAAGRIVATRSPESAEATYAYATAYDEAGRATWTRVSLIGGDGRVLVDDSTAIAYDRLGRATEQTVYGVAVDYGSAAETPAPDTTTVRYTHLAEDDLGNWTERLELDAANADARYTFRVIRYRGEPPPFDVSAVSGPWASPDGARGLWLGGGRAPETDRTYPPMKAFASVPDYEHPRKAGDFVYAVDGVRFSRGTALARGPKQVTFLSDDAQPPRTFDVELAGPPEAPTSFRLRPADGEGDVLEWVPVAQNGN